MNMTKRIILWCIILSAGAHPVLSQVKWQARASRPIAGACKAVVYKNKIYIASTDTEQRIIIEEYNPEIDRWVSKKAKSHMENAGEFSLAATGPGIYIFGGYRDGASLDHMEKFNVENDTFIIMKNMPIGLDCATAVSMNNVIYIMGGRSADNSPLSGRLFSYDPFLDSWEEKQSTAYGRVESHAVALNGKIYLFGGYISSDFSGNIDKCDNRIDIYDPVSDSWNSGGIDFAPGKTSIGMGVIRNMIYFVVADFGSTGPVTEEIFKYDPLSKSAVKTGDRAELTWLMGVVSLDDIIYFIGGIKGEFPTGERQNSTLMLSESMQGE
jgi:N-acetylneuraminic acid mutarotase